MSLRATGEGHVSSIVFRSGVLDSHNTFLLDPTSDYVKTPDVHLDRVYDRHLFRLKLKEMGAGNEITAHVLDHLPENFTYSGLKNKIEGLLTNPVFPMARQNGTFEIMYWLANSNYEMYFQPDHLISERVIFPVSKNESRGIEDARFVQFFDDNGEVTYYATYTAYNGLKILPQLIETKDFIKFNILTLNGKAVQNKGMALFPRKIDGRYVMLSHQDGENNHIMFSDNIHFWQKSEIIQEPTRPWEFIQIGNCVPGNLFRSATAAHPWKPMRDGSYSPTVSGLCVNIALAPYCLILKTRQKSSPAWKSRYLSRMRKSARGMSPMSFIPAARLSIITSWSFPMPCPISCPA
jgi:hypothetical protein